jgi:hypothetical protein
MQDCAPPMELEVIPPTHESGAVPVLKPAMFSPFPTLQAWAGVAAALYGRHSDGAFRGGFSGMTDWPQATLPRNSINSGYVDIAVRSRCAYLQDRWRATPA